MVPRRWSHPSWVSGLDPAALDAAFEWIFKRVGMDFPHGFPKGDVTSRELGLATERLKPEPEV